VDVAISRASEDRLLPLASVLGRAFVVEPILRWALGEHGNVEERFVRCFAYCLEELLPLGVVWEAGEADGAAIWVPPDHNEAWQQAMMHDERTGTLTLDGGRHYAAFWEWADSNIPDEPFWHLDSVAVNVEARGRGIGTALIEHGLTQARSAGVAAWLETGNPRNVGYYETLGFVVVEEARPPGDGPPVWFMRCD
jgi:GNAT superfamily N-acetyltransferase